jgi:phage-related protein
MYSLQSIKPFIFSYTWQFIEVYTVKISTISCLAYSIEEARAELLSTLKKIESLAAEKKKAEDKIKKLYKIQQTLTIENGHQISKQIDCIKQELKQKFPSVNDYTGGYGTRANDYDSNLQVIYYEKSTNKEITTTLDVMISTTEPKIEPIRVVTFT